MNQCCSSSPSYWQTHSAALNTHDAMKFCHPTAQVRSLLLQRQVEWILQDVLIIHSHKELAVWILEMGIKGRGQHYLKKRRKKSPETPATEHQVAKLWARKSSRGTVRSRCHGHPPRGCGDVSVWSSAASKEHDGLKNTEAATWTGP